MRFVLAGARLLLKIVFSLFFMSAGVLHFTNASDFLKIMPDYIPQSLHAPAVYISGVFEILLGGLLLVPRTRRLAAWGLIALLVAVFPANIHVYQHPELIPGVGPTAHLLRLPLQGVMIAWAWCYTRTRQPRPANPSGEQEPAAKG
jgi:uncharacterized membrane protein